MSLGPSLCEQFGHDWVCVLDRNICSVCRIRQGTSSE